MSSMRIKGKGIGHEEVPPLLRPRLQKPERKSAHKQQGGNKNGAGSHDTGSFRQRLRTHYWPLRMNATKAASSQPPSFTAFREAPRYSKRP